MDSSVKKENYDLVLYRLEQIERKLDVMSRNYVTKEEFDEFKQGYNDLLKFNELAEKFLNQNKRNKKWTKCKTRIKEILKNISFKWTSKICIK